FLRTKPIVRADWASPSMTVREFLKLAYDRVIKGTGYEPEPEADKTWHWMPRPGVTACNVDYPNMNRSDDPKRVTCMACLDVYFRRNENVKVAADALNEHPGLHRVRCTPVNGDLVASEDSSPVQQTAEQAIPNPLANREGRINFREFI